MRNDFWKKPVLRLDFPRTPGKMRERKFELLPRKSSAKRISWLADRRKQIYLLDLNIIACVGLSQAECEKYGRGVWSRAHNYSFANNLTRRVVPFILCRHASVPIHSGPSIHIKREPLGLISVFMLGARITEDSEII